MRRLTQYALINVEHTDELCTNALQVMMMDENKDEGGNVIPYPDRTYNELLSYFAPNAIETVRFKDGVAIRVIPFYNRMDFSTMTQEEINVAVVQIEALLSPCLTLLSLAEYEDYGFDVELENI